MMDMTARLALPLLSAGQSQKEVFHNEALQRIDACLAPCVIGAASATPPASPAVGDCYVVGSAATGAWAGKAGSLAAFTEGGWRFIAGREGLRLWVSGQNVEAVFHGGAWEFGSLRGAQVVIGGVPVVGAQQGAIAGPAGGSVIDSQARATLGQILVALRAHGLIAT